MVTRTIEIYSAGCSTCQDTIDMVKKLAGSHEVHIRDMQQRETADQAKRLGIKSLPAVVVDGQLAGCCTDRGPDEQVLREALR
jgi:glutaredoxin 3